MQFKFKNMKAFYLTRSKLTKGIIVKSISSDPLTFEVYESKIDPITRFCHVQNIMTAGFIKVKDYVTSNTRASINVQVEHTNVYPSVDQDRIAPFRVLSWDIETKPADGVSFPNSTNPGDIIAMIGITMWTFGTPIPTPVQKHKEFVKIVITERPCGPVGVNGVNGGGSGVSEEEVIVLQCSGEKEL